MWAGVCSTAGREKETPEGAIVSWNTPRSPHEASARSGRSRDTFPEIPPMWSTNTVILGAMAKCVRPTTLLPIRGAWSRRASRRDGPASARPAPYCSILSRLLRRAAERHAQSPGQPRRSASISYSCSSNPGRAASSAVGPPSPPPAPPVPPATWRHRLGRAKELGSGADADDHRAVGCLALDPLHDRPVSSRRMAGTMR